MALTSMRGFENTGAVIRRLRDLVAERREYLMAAFMNGLTETMYHQTIGEVRGLDHAIGLLDDIEKGN